jgi:hypothetical protein
LAGVHGSKVLSLRPSPRVAAPPASAPLPARTRRILSTLVAAAVVVVLAIFLTAVALREQRERAAVRALPEEARRALFARTMDTLAACEAARAQRTPFCQEQARIALRFPECDAACRARAAEILPAARR